MTKDRDWYRKIHIHPTLWFSIVVAILTGTVTEVTIVFAIVSFHEFGHWFIAYHFRWKVRKVVFWMFGGVMETEEHGSKPIKEEMLITIAGPFQHIVIYFFLIVSAHYQWFPESVLDLAHRYNKTILFFNLLPIRPLDGGRLFGLLLAKYLPFKKAHAYSILTSLSIIILVLILLIGLYPLVLNTIVVFTFLLWENRVEWKQRYYVFLRFLIRKAEYPIHNLKTIPLMVGQNTKLIQLFAHFRRDCNHLIFISNDDQSVVDEADCLYVYFTLKQYRATVKEVTKWLKK